MIHEVEQGRLFQGTEEQIAYTLTTTPWGASPSSITVKAYDVTSGLVDVSSTVLLGTASAVGDVITTPLIRSLTEGKLYRVEVKFTCSKGNVLECFFEIQTER